MFDFYFSTANCNSTINFGVKGKNLTHSELLRNKIKLKLSRADDPQTGRKQISGVQISFRRFFIKNWTFIV